LALLTGGGLLLQTFLRLQSADLGFKPDNVLVAFVNPPRQSYDTPAKQIAYYDQVLEKASALPGVRKAALASVLPLSGDSDTSFLIEGRPAPTSQSETPVTWYREVSAGYFDAMGMNLKAGRAFAERESAPTVVVNDTMARKYFPGENPLGRRVRLGGPNDAWFTIIGIVADAKVRGAREDTRVETFIPYWQFPEAGMNIILQTATDPGALAAPLKQALYSIDPTIPVQSVGTLSELVRESVEQPRFLAMLAAAFSILALTLAGIGIYGVMAYTVSQRTTELGVRMALGARRSEVFSLVMADSLRVTAVGVAVGIGGSLIVARSLGTLLFGIEPTDPLTLTATAAILVIVATVASVIPARRATTVDPIVALRAE
jgi:putative ABC transport system permease protein